jgi:hypothetical protein
MFTQTLRSRLKDFIGGKAWALSDQHFSLRLSHYTRGHDVMLSIDFTLNTGQIPSGALFLTPIVITRSHWPFGPKPPVF